MGDGLDAWDLMGDPSSYGLGGLGGLDLGSLDLGGSGELNAGFGGGGTPISDPGINWGADQGSNWNGNADPFGGFTMDQLNTLSRLAGNVPGASGSKQKPGMFTNPDGSINWAALLPMALSGISGAMNSSATNHATQQTIDGINNASTQATNLINGASAGYQPYMQAGTSALSKLASMGPSNLAAQFGALGSGRGLEMTNAPLPGQFRK